MKALWSDKLKFQSLNEFFQLGCILQHLLIQLMLGEYTFYLCALRYTECQLNLIVVQFCYESSLDAPQYVLHLLKKNVVSYNDLYFRILSDMRLEVSHA